ncbi:hypothetical protein I6A84_43205 [Frankia sp. CNm7]|uniref:Uncharacterized protein n=1 Tax=Frankia nepalensis TaxID=1836974 RepID=A0A937RLI5_9ACTN|nr:hypothetical protein [Frankia nepalensis]MBL7496208.1 hypothetical protein [Frankia nepalensis]MBL7511653.1 hypothetical protein [Frankia nepalensis]MBL7524674.1 hypothetical protein [Frankia nepalensis]MBL7631105.1 hypothetical protein [Frankia nepalensis]
MLATQLNELAGAPPVGVDAALAVVDGFDDALAAGLGRLGAGGAEALAALASAVGATPLGARAREAADKAAAGSVSDEVLVTLAGARAALLGAAHDALLAGFDAAAGRARPAVEAAPAAVNASPPGWAAALAGCRSWLRELAIAGWRGVDDELVSASAQARQAARAEPGLRRLAVLLDGLAAELRASCPVGAAARLPARRWADLWARAQLLAWKGAWPPGPSEPAKRVSGRLLILGAEVAEHDTAVRVQVHGVLEPAGGADEGPALVRAGVTAAKVDTIVGPALWRLLDAYPVLLGALAERRAVEVTDLALLPGGDLVWREDGVRLGEAADPFVTARVLLAGAAAPAAVPLDRHPVRIAEPVLLEGYATSVDEGHALAFDLGGIPLGVDVGPADNPAASHGPLTAELLAASSACLGLLRWDDGAWRLRPLAAQAVVRRKAVTAHAGDWALGVTDPKIAKVLAKQGDSVAVLRERAGRLLRK